MDINLPKINGIELCKILTKKIKNLKLIALSSLDDTYVVKKIMGNGASGYLLKNTHPSELQEAIMTVMKGETYLQKEIKEKLLQQTLGLSKEKKSFQVKLTRREKEVLECIYEELTTQESAEKLFISPKTIETHRMNLMSKLGARNSVGIIKAAIERGFLKG